MSFFGQSIKEEPTVSQTIESVQIIKIFFDSDTSSLDSMGFASGTAFVCLIVYTDGTKKIDVVNLKDMNRRYVSYLKPDCIYYP